MILRHAWKCDGFCKLKNAIFYGINYFKELKKIEKIDKLLNSIIKIYRGKNFW